MSSPPPATRRLLPRSIAGRVVLGVLAALVVLACTFDWNWCRPLIRHYVMSHSGRDIQFDDLQVHWRDGLDPTIEFRGLTIENAPWAASRQPFIHAGRIAATLSWRSLGSDLVTVDMIEMEDAQVDMERLANGVRNWRLGHPDDTGPAHARVLAVDARRSTLHTIHRGIGLELEATTMPLDAPQTLPAHATLPLTKRLTFAGTLDGHAFEGDTQVSDVLTLGATPRKFALRGTARMGSLKLDVAGLSNDVHALGDIDVDGTLATEGNGAPWPLPEGVARVRPLVARGHVIKIGDQWNADDLRLAAGRHTSLAADVAFTGTLRSDTPRRTLKATLRDAVVDMDDLSLLRGKTPPGEKTLPQTRPDADHALSNQPLPLARLRDVDADVDLRTARVVGAERAFAQTVRAHAVLAAGVLRVQPLDVGLADGHLVGTLVVDAAKSPASVAVDLRARQLHVDQLSATLAANGALSGAVDGRASVRTRGESSRALAANATGNVTLSLADGATVSKRLDAKLGLNGGEWLRTLFDKSARVPVQCAEATLALAHGVATVRSFVFETPDTALAAEGSLNLVDETVDTTLTPAHKKLALLSLDRSIHAGGSWHDVKIRLAPASAAQPARCVRPAREPATR
jgi:uncharacterized protein involved in outer membrane biogenesis